MLLHEYIREIVDVPLRPEMEGSAADETFYMFGHNDGSSPWQEMATNYIIPPCGPQCRERGTKTLGIGGQYSGVQLHLHGPTFSETIIGRKQWFVLPLDSQLNISSISNMTMAHWVTNVYPSLPPVVREGIYMCILEPGEAIYLPSRVMHGTLNLDTYNVFMSLFV